MLHQPLEMDDSTEKIESPDYEKYRVFPKYSGLYISPFLIKY